MSIESLRRRARAIGEAARRVAPDMLNDDDRAMLERLAASPTVLVALARELVAVLDIDDGVVMRHSHLLVNGREDDPDAINVQRPLEGLQEALNEANRCYLNMGIRSAPPEPIEVRFARRILPTFDTSQAALVRMVCEHGDR